MLMPLVSLKKLFFLTLLEVIVLTGLFMLLMYVRFNQFGHETFSGCFQMGLNTDELQLCMYEVVAHYMNSPTWMAIQYTLLVVPAIFVSYMMMRRFSGAQIELGLFSGAISTILIWLILTPPLMPAIAAFTGIPLGALMAYSLTKRKVKPAVSF